jgi:heme-degrading monooxygenase HmoA
MIAETPNPPYYAVIFTSERTDGDNGYREMAELMVVLASEQDGFLGIESAREEIGITVSYWRDLSSIQKWREHVQHTVARNKGRSDWYSAFKTRIALVERDYGFARDRNAGGNNESKLDRV